MFRKRYTVVIVGDTGSSAAQRSEVSQHRSERDALLAAQYERERLGTLHGDGTGKYRVVVEREGEVISTGPVADLSGLPPEITLGEPDDELELTLLESSTDPGRTHPVIRSDAVAPEPPEPQQAHEPLEAPEPQADAGTPAEPAPIARAADTVADVPGGPEAPVDATADEIPEGPVPEDILRRFEEAIEREQERKRARLPREP
jgi:hypothetical protein